MKVRFFTFSSFHGKYPDVGSTNIRVNQLIKYWPEADKYLYGEKPDVLIFQKVYSTPDYKFPNHFEGIKILDICDADYLDGVTAIKETVDSMNAVVTSSDNLTKFIKQLTDKPVITIDDRFDLELIPKPKKHTKTAKTVVWFGYRHNSESLSYAMKKIDELGLSLIVISDDDPLAWQWVLRTRAEEYRNNKYKYYKYNEENVYQHLQKADFCVLPKGIRPVDYFKSNNKTTKAILAGLPVAVNGDDLEKYMKASERQKFINENYKKIKKGFDVRQSVEQYKTLINQLT